MLLNLEKGVLLDLEEGTGCFWIWRRAGGAFGFGGGQRVLLQLEEGRGCSCSWRRGGDAFAVGG